MKQSHFREFFQDAHGAFNAFTLIALLAGVTLVTAPGICRLLNWPVLGRDEMYCLTFLYVIAALGDAALGIFLNKLPSTVNLDTGGGDASLNTATGTATATTDTSPPPPNAAD
jgi:hypothetical protein